MRILKTVKGKHDDKIDLRAGGQDCPDFCTDIVGGEAVARDADGCYLIVDGKQAAHCHQIISQKWFSTTQGDGFHCSHLCRKSCDLLQRKVVAGISPHIVAAMTAGHVAAGGYREYD